MRLKIDISTVRFRVAGAARPRQVSRNDKTQKRTPPSDGGRLIYGRAEQGCGVPCVSGHQLVYEG